MNSFSLVKPIAPAGNRTRGPTMATLDFTTALVRDRGFSPVDAYSLKLSPTYLDGDTQNITQRPTKYITHKPRGSRLTADPLSIDNTERRNKKTVAIRPEIADVLASLGDGGKLCGCKAHQKYMTLLKQQSQGKI